MKKGVLEISQNPQEKTFTRVIKFLNKVAGLHDFIKKETLAQVLFCEFCEISKNTSEGLLLECVSETWNHVDGINYVWLF